MIDPILIKAKKEVFNSRNGIFTSLVQSEGFDFNELSEYDYQSDARKIDWKSYAKTRKLYQKNFSKELSRNIAIIPILTGSLFFGQKKLKLELLYEASTLLSYSALLLKDSLLFGSILQKSCPLKPLSKLYECDMALKSLAKEKIVGKKFEYDLKELFFKLPEKYLIIFIGDFLYPLDLTLLSSRHDVVSIIVQEDLSAYNETFVALDNETLKEKSTNLSKNSLQTYLKNRQKMIDQNILHFQQCGVDYMRVNERDFLFEKLSLFFGSR